LSQAFCRDMMLVYKQKLNFGFVAST